MKTEFNLIKLATTVAGTILLLLGAIMLITPGPGLLFVTAGLVVLAKNYRWPRRFLDWIRSRFPS